MHKKSKINGHVVHKLPKCNGLYYTVEPENSRIVVHMLKYDEGTGEPYYRYYGHTNIWAKQLGRHGYLAEELNLLILKYSDITPVRNYLEYEKLTREDLKALNNTIFKEEKKMGEIRKDRFILCEDEDCYLEITPISNNVIFHFGGETQTIQIPDTYDLQFSVDDKKKSCDLKTVKKKPKLLNMKFTVKEKSEKLTREDLKALNNTIFKEEKKMTEYYVIDVEMTLNYYKTTATECLQIRQKGSYFEIPFDGPDCSEYRLDRLERCLNDYILETKKMFCVRLIRSGICDNSILEITTPYDDISDDRNREELCKMLTYAVEHREYPYPVGDAGLTKICFCLRECKNHEIYKKVYSDGIDCVIRINGNVARHGSYCDYIQEPTDVVRLRFKNGRLATFVLAGDPVHESEAELYNIPAALYDIYNSGKPFQNVEEVKSLLLAIHTKRTMWKNASHITFVVIKNRD